MYLKRVLPALLAAGALVFAGCGDEDPTPNGDSSQPVATGAVVTITEPTVEAAAKADDTSAVYMKLVSNKGDKLVKAEVSSTTAVRAELVTKSVPVSSIELPADQLVQLKPNGSQIRLVGLKQGISAGEFVDLKLTFEKAGTLSVAAEATD